MALFQEAQMGHPAHPTSGCQVRRQKVPVHPATDPRTQVSSQGLAMKGNPQADRHPRSPTHH